MKFTEMNLHETLIQALNKHGLNNPTEIQKQFIPLALEGGDIMASANTGTGKTLAFLLPLIDRLLKNPARQAGPGPRVLVLTPTRELATQVTDWIQKMAQFAHLRFGSITGGVSYFGQEALLKKPFDFLVATPGRLLDHMRQGRVNFSRLEALVLDEADRMLDMGFAQDIDEISKVLPKERQILLLSATLEGPVLKVARQMLHKPACIQLASESKPNHLITQSMHQVDNARHKLSLLVKLLADSSVFQAIVFTSTKRASEEVADDLHQEGIKSAALNGDMKQGKRTRTLERMRAGQVHVLVATDVAARGLDLKSISHVVNYDLPKSVEDYIHRIGRTGRAGETGIAISFVGPRDWGQLSLIERTTGHKLKRDCVPGMEPKENVSSGRASNAGHRAKPFQQGGKSQPKGRSRFSEDNRSPKPQGRSRFAQEERSARPEGKSRFSQNDRNAKPQGRSRFAQEERGARPEGRSRFSQEDRNAKPQGRSRFTQEERGARPEGRSGFSQEDRNAKPQGRSRFAQEERGARPEGKRFSQNDRNAKPQGRSRFAQEERGARPEGRSRFSQEDRNAKPQGRSRFAQEERGAKSEGKPRFSQNDRNVKPQSRSRFSQDDRNSKVQGKARVARTDRSSSQGPERSPFVRAQRPASASTKLKLPKTAKPVRSRTARERGNV